MNLIQTLLGREETRSGSKSLSLEEWLQWFSFDGLHYPIQTLKNADESAPNNFGQYVESLYKANGPVFALMLVRQMIFSEARFQFRRRSDGRPGELFGTRDLRILERPWPGGTTGDLLARAIQDADLAGNHYALRRLDQSGRPRIRRMRPDWTTIVLGSQEDPDNAGIALDAEVVGYIYQPGGPDARKEPIALSAEEVAHFAPIPDPMANYRGMSWLTPVIREVLGDKAMQVHKNKFLEQGATPNMVVKLDPKISKEAFEGWIDKFEAQHKGYTNAYKTLYLGGGADTTVVGADFRQLDFKAVQGAGETRLASAAGVPPVIVGFAEGLQGSSLNAGNYGQARRRLSDGTIRPLWRNIAGSYETIINTPPDAELWYDDRDIPFLEEDLKDRAEVQGVRARAIRQLTDAGFTPESVIDAIDSDDFTRLEHSGLFSVQLQGPEADDGDQENDEDDDSDD